MRNASEKARVLRTEKSHNSYCGRVYLRLVPSTAFGNHFYTYSHGEDFGPSFLRFCSYFPQDAKLRSNGH